MPQLAPFQISHPTIAGLLSQYVMKIPELQRTYAWKKSQALELCSDLERLLQAARDGEDYPQHFFGTLVVVMQAGQRDDIVDGQQRMTTVTLLLGKIRKSLIELTKACQQIANENAINRPIAQHHQAVAGDAEALSTQIRNMLFVNDGIGENGIIWKPRVAVSPEIKATYLDLIEGRSGTIPSEHRDPANNLREVAEVFEQRLVEPPDYANMEPRNKFIHLDQLMRVVQDGLIVVRLGTTDSTAAYELFESLNARGLALNALDHLKVWMLSVFAERGIDDAVVATRMRLLSNDDSNEQVKFFENFYEARTQDNHQFDGVLNPKPLVAAARKSVFHDPAQHGTPDVKTLTDRIEFEVDYMTQLFPVWRKLKQTTGNNPYLPSFFVGAPHETWMRNRLELLIGPTLIHQKIYPYLMVAAERLRDDSVTFGELLHTIEKFFFRYKTICSGSERSIAEMYNSFLVALDANPGFDLGFVKSRMKLMLNDVAPNAKFKSKLVEKLVYGSPKEKIRTKYFFEMLDDYCYQPKPRKRPQRLKLSEWHLEHIVPQNPQANDPNHLSDEELNSIGNLCLLPPWINTRLSNKTYEDKQKTAKELRDIPGKGCIKIELADAEAIFYNGNGPFWTSEDVRSRCLELQKFACQVFAIV